MTTYTWEVEQLIVKPVEDALPNVVKRVICNYVADDGAGKTYAQLMNVELDPPDPMDFIPFADLTLLDVQGWLEAKVDTATWQDYLDARIAEQYLTYPECPWEA